ncbi:hypothetical protein [Paenibacillus sp. CF384]|uniref:hypothetical protein n=1 Tax=Paenibacillus sp. CF384 TaxID=1884382 RepID=UPI00115FD24B|nr:hypothetical protein [Paenibacillus sp. CF384]
MSAEGVRYALQKMGVERRTVREAFEALGNQEDSHFLSTAKRDEIPILYASGQSTVQIARLFGVTEAAIRQQLLTKGIAPRSISEARTLSTQHPETQKRQSESLKRNWQDPAYREKMIVALDKNKIAFTSTEEQMARLRGVLAGMLLGDGSLHIQKGGRHASYSMTHTIKQRAYLEFKATILREITPLNYYETAPKPKIPNGQVQCKTKTNPFYTELRSIVYPNGQKTVTLEWLNWLTLEGLALWYMDDGSLSKRRSYNKRGQYRIASRCIQFATCGFSLEEQEILRIFVKERFDLDFKTVKSHQTAENTYYSLRAAATVANKLFDLIRPFVVPCMAYKIDMEYDVK